MVEYVYLSASQRLLHLKAYLSHKKRSLKSFAGTTGSAKAAARNYVVNNIADSGLLGQRRLESGSYLYGPTNE